MKSSLTACTVIILLLVTYYYITTPMAAQKNIFINRPLYGGGDDGNTNRKYMKHGVRSTRARTRTIHQVIGNQRVFADRSSGRGPVHAARRRSGGGGDRGGRPDSFYFLRSHSPTS